MTQTASVLPVADTAYPVVTGIDVSLTGTGLASSRGWCEAIGHKARGKEKGITTLPHIERIAAMKAVRNRVLLAIGTPCLAVMETPAFSQSGGGAHERAWLWWEVYDYLTQHDVPIGLVGTGQLKVYATGKGTAAKTAVVDAVARRWSAWETGGDDNAADAVVLMAAGLDHLGCPLTVMPAAHRAVLEKIPWPQL